jgi:hypothetical protein
MAIWSFQSWRIGRAATRRSVVMFKAALAWYMLSDVRLKLMYALWWIISPT